VGPRAGLDTVEKINICCRERLRWRGPAAFVNDRPILSSEMILYKDYNRKCSVQKEILVVGLKGFGANTNRSAVNRQS
jgi:hypothetical protein